MRGETVTLAGTALTLTEMATAFGDALGERIQPVTVPPSVARSKVGEDYVSLFEWYNREQVADPTAALQETYDFTPTSLSEYLVDAEWTTPGLSDQATVQRVQ
jgi:hypothetical protein